jgi:hypothetical protein
MAIIWYSKKRGFFHIFNVMWLDWLGAAILRRNGRVQSCSPAYTNSKNALIAEPARFVYHHARRREFGLRFLNLAVSRRGDVRSACGVS